MGVPASRLKCRLKRYATLGVSTEDQPLIESCCEVVPTEALKPLTTGMMPAGPLSLVVAAAVTPPNSSSTLSGVAWASPQRGNAGNRHIETNQGSRELRTRCEWNKGSTSVRQGNTLPSQMYTGFAVARALRMRLAFRHRNIPVRIG